jgi:hypothetical protein
VDTTPGSTEVRVAFRAPGELMRRVDDFCLAAGFASRGAGIRALIAAGLTVPPQSDPAAAELFNRRHLATTFRSG